MPDQLAIASEDIATMMKKDNLKVLILEAFEQKYNKELQLKEREKVVVWKATEIPQNQFSLHKEFKCSAVEHACLTQTTLKFA